VAYGHSTIVGEEPLVRGGGPRRGSRSVLPWGGALALGAIMAWHTPAPLSPAAMPHVVTPAVVAAHPVVALARVRPKVLANPYGGLIAFAGGPGNPFGALVPVVADPAPPSPSPASSLLASLEAAQSAPAAIAAKPVVAKQDAPSPPKRDEAAIDLGPPLPPARPAEFASLAKPAPIASRPLAPNTAPTRALPPPADNNVFERPLARARSTDSAVAYAAPDDQFATSAKSPALAAMDRASGTSSFARSAPPPAGDNLTAVYDISARTVTLPDGTKLEAHSGLGPMLDDPRFVAEHNRGATPPHVYELESRGELFHGVQALRLDPVGGDATIFGRSGLLAHTYMLGPNGDSNGCVSFKDYDAFLRAYQQGRVKRLAVVARM
jgi:hypothetical protein